MNARALIEAEADEFVKTKHRVRDQEGMTARYFRIFGQSFGKPNVDTGQDVGFTSGSRTFERVDGVWWETKRAKNPAYYAQPQYFLIYGPIPDAFVVVKMPRTLKAALFRRAVGQIWRDRTGKAYSADCGIEGADEAIYNARISGQKPQFAYEVFADGTWDRVQIPP